MHGFTIIKEQLLTTKVTKKTCSYKIRLTKPGDLNVSTINF